MHRTMCVIQPLTDSASPEDVMAHPSTCDDDAAVDTQKWDRNDTQVVSPQNNNNNNPYNTPPHTHTHTHLF